ncbi:MAG: potassium transporter TrkG, partial [Bacillota bacterium]|nr:potassium transporter TrkG [Bacillota bacterium]
MNYRFILQTLGKAILIEAGALMSALAVAFYYGEETYQAFAVTIFLLFCIGGAMVSVKLKEKQVRPLDGLVVVSLCWISLTFLGAIPFMLTGSIPSLADAFFETASGLTTTGASIIEDYSVFGRAELYWRSLTNWIGGMGVIVLLLTLSNKGGKGVLHVLRAEVPGPTVEKIVPKMRKTAIILYKIYIFITLAEVLSLCVAGLSFYESLVLSFATAGTGGFTITALSVGAYSPAVHWIVGTFMIIFGINFSVYFYIILGKFGKVFKHEETRAFLTIVFLSVVLIAFNIAPLYGNW